MTLPPLQVNHFPLPEDLFAPPFGGESQSMGRWPYMGKYDFTNAVPTAAQIREKCTQTWLSMCDVVYGSDIFKKDQCALLRRPPVEMDKKPERESTVHWALPIQLNTGTTSYADTLKRLRHAVSCGTANLGSNDMIYFIVIGDMQTFQRDYWYLLLHPEEFPNVVPMAGT